MVGVSAAFGFRNCAVDTAEFGEVLGCNAKGFGSQILFARVAPHDRGASFGRDNGIDGVLHHENAIGNSDGQCSAATAFARDSRNDWNFETSHFTQVMGNGFGLASLFGPQTGVSSGGVDKSEDGAPEFFGKLHSANCFAVAFRIRHAEIAIDLLLGVAGLLMANDQPVVAVEAGHAAHDGGVIGKPAIAVNLAPIGEDAFDIVESVRTLDVPGKLGLAPGIHVGVDLFAKGVDSLAQLMDLLEGTMVLSRDWLELG